MKQYKITSQNIPTKSDEDCYLAPDDPVHELIIAHTMDGLGAHARLDEYRAKQSFNKVECDKGKYQRENNIKPGTPAWFELWYGDKR